MKRDNWIQQDNSQANGQQLSSSPPRRKEYLSGEVQGCQATVCTMIPLSDATESMQKSCSVSLRLPRSSQYTNSRPILRSLSPLAKTLPARNLRYPDFTMTSNAEKSTKKDFPSRASLSPIRVTLQRPSSSSSVQTQSRINAEQQIRHDGSYSNQCTIPDSPHGMATPTIQNLDPRDPLGLYVQECGSSFLQSHA